MLAGSFAKDASYVYCSFNIRHGVMRIEMRESVRGSQLIKFERWPTLGI
ncbi:hypothetical protein OCEANICA350_20034 [Oceanicaulis sp. 350]|nr:hypothetical protein OCEANICA350_20034 [Oceanicaulis sp. 350]